MIDEPGPSLDYHLLEELHQTTGPSRSFMNQVAELFREEAEAFELGVDSMPQGDRAAALHSLAGAARTVGMKDLAQQALRGEQAFKDGRSDAQYVAYVRNVLPGLIQLLEAWTAALPED